MNQSMRIGLTGATGLLGRALADHLIQCGHTVIAGVYESRPAESARMNCELLDLTNPASTEHWIATARAECIIHAAAWTDVDGCERDPSRAFTLNASATRVLSDANRRCNRPSRIVYISTDYVFDGESGPKDENAAPAPINVYGASKLEGERILLSADFPTVIVRSASFLGVGAGGRPTFAEGMLERMKKDPPLLAASDQRSNVTSVRFLAQAITELIEDGHTGIRHLAGAEILSRCDLARAIAREFGLPEDSVEGVPYSDLMRPAQRPLNGGLVSVHALRTKPEPLERTIHLWRHDLMAGGHWHD